MEPDAIAAAMRAALAGVLAEEEFDLAVVPASREVEIATDDWTLHLERLPDGIAWLAIEEEPSSTGAYTGARRAVMAEAVERALTKLDLELDRGLSRALRASGDPFSAAFAADLEAR